MAGDVRLPVSVTAALIAIAIVVLALTDAQDTDEALTGNEASQEEPTASPWLALPEWVTASPETFKTLGFGPELLEVDTGLIWQIRTQGQAPPGVPSAGRAEFLSWAPNGEVLIGVSGGGRTALHIGEPGGELRLWLTVDGSGFRTADVSWSPDGSLVVVSSSIFEATSGDIVAELPPSTATMSPVRM